MKQILSLMIVLMFAAAAVAEPPADAKTKPLTVRTYQFKYKNAERAATIIKSLISAEGSMSIQPSTNALVVTDHPENLKNVTNALADFDVAPKPVKLSVRLVGASRGDKAVPAPAELRDVAANFEMLRYNIESLGEANIEGHEGEPGTVDLSNGYHADFKFGEYDKASDSIAVSDFTLSKLQKDQLAQVYKASWNLTVGQTLIFGVKRSEGSRAIFIVLVAHR